MRKIFMIWVAVSLLLLTGCAGLNCSLTSLDNIERNKQKTEQLITKTTTPYQQNTSDIQSIKLSLSSAVSYENSRGKTNIATVNMWKALESFINDDFLKTWETNTVLSAVAADELKTRVKKLYEYLSTFENYKKKPCK